MMRWRCACLIAACAAQLLACDTEPRRAAPARVANSQSLYGDPALVPTPEGERARRELALAGDLRALLPLDDARVVIRLPEDAPARVLVEATAAPETSTDALRSDIQRATASIVDPDAQLELLLHPARETPTRRPATDPLLWLALVAFGLSAGVAIDRRRRARDRLLG